mgnify:FL=1
MNDQRRKARACCDNERCATADDQAEEPRATELEGSRCLLPVTSWQTSPSFSPRPNKLSQQLQEKQQALEEEERCKCRCWLRSSARGRRRGQVLSPADLPSPALGVSHTRVMYQGFIRYRITESESRREAANSRVSRVADLRAHGKATSPLRSLTVMALPIVDILIGNNGNERVACNNVPSQRDAKGGQILTYLYRAQRAASRCLRVPHELAPVPPTAASRHRGR